MNCIPTFIMSCMFMLFLVSSYQSIREFAIYRYNVYKQSDEMRCEIYENSCEMIHSYMKNNSYYYLPHEIRIDMMNNCDKYEKKCKFDKSQFIKLIMVLVLEFYVFVLVPGCIICMYRHKITGFFTSNHTSHTEPFLTNVAGRLMHNAVESGTEYIGLR